jgi:hypothetical protein
MDSRWPPAVHGRSALPHRPVRPGGMRGILVTNLGSTAEEVGIGRCDPLTSEASSTSLPLKGTP